MEKVKLEFTFVKTSFQLAEAYSQEDDHLKAKKVAKKCLEGYSSLINLLQNCFNGNGEDG